MKTITQNKINSGMLVATVLALSFVVSLSVSAQSEMSMGKSSMHRSVVSHVANELDRIADRDSGMGKELRGVAKEQSDSKETTAEAMDKVENRSGLKTFFL